MNLELSDEHKMIQKTAREFAQNEVKPRAHEIDESGEFPHATIKKAAELGFTGVYVPEEYGGAGFDHIAYAIVIEEISRVCASTGVILSVCNTLFCDPILRFGTEEQKKKYVVPHARGEKIGCYSLTEPQAGSDAANQKSTAVLKGDKYILNGTKAWVTNGTVADTAIVYAVTDPAKGSKGISAFIVESSFPGWKVAREEKKMGINATATAEILLQDCEVPRENLLGGEGNGFKIALRTLDDGRVGIAAQATGIAQGAFDEALKYAQERVQFGQPIAKFQAIQFMLADMNTEIEAARVLLRRAAWLQDQIGFTTTQPCYTLEASIAKLFASEMAARVCHKAVQIHGGYGYSRDYAVERMYRDQRITELYEGTSEIQRLVIARHLLA
ncbi:MAG TPA: acyl-CoA dehydrogenase [Candidatus Acidoferrales bacterium]|nr:acyl-CoA dehydrogenase [Candidatus Acidoferrales bacterium]